MRQLTHFGVLGQGLVSSYSHNFSLELVGLGYSFKGYEPFVLFLHVPKWRANCETQGSSGAQDFDATSSLPGVKLEDFLNARHVYRETELRVEHLFLGQLLQVLLKRESVNVAAH